MILSNFSHIANLKISLGNFIPGTDFWSGSEYAIYWIDWQPPLLYLQGAFRRNWTSRILSSLRYFRLFFVTIISQVSMTTTTTARILATSSLSAKLSFVFVADGFTVTNLVSLVKEIALAIFSHRHSTAGIWNGTYGTPSQKFLSRRTVSWTSWSVSCRVFPLRDLRKKDDWPLMELSKYRKPITRTNSIWIVIFVQRAQFFPSLNAEQWTDVLIFTFPWRNGEWN